MKYWVSPTLYIQWNIRNILQRKKPLILSQTKISQISKLKLHILHKHMINLWRMEYIQNSLKELFSKSDKLPKLWKRKLSKMLRRHFLKMYILKFLIPFIQDRHDEQSKPCYSISASKNKIFRQLNCLFIDQKFSFAKNDLSKSFHGAEVKFDPKNCTGDDGMKYHSIRYHALSLFS